MPNRRSWFIGLLGFVLVAVLLLARSRTAHAQGLEFFYLRIDQPMSNETIAGPILPVSATVTTNGELTGAFAKVYAGNLQQSYDAAANGSDAGTIETALSMPVSVGPSLWNTSGTLDIEALPRGPLTLFLRATFQFDGGGTFGGEANANDQQVTFIHDPPASTPPAAGCGCNVGRHTPTTAHYFFVAALLAARKRRALLPNARR